jgi:hypothetical protein
MDTGNPSFRTPFEAPHVHTEEYYIKAFHNVWWAAGIAVHSVDKEML